MFNNAAPCSYCSSVGRSLSVDCANGVAGLCSSKSVADMADAVAWFRRDLRLQDNESLAAACDHARGGELTPLFIIDPLLWSHSGIPRRAYLLRALEALNNSLGGRLVLRIGDSRCIVPEVAAGRAVFCAEDFSPYGRLRDAQVQMAGVDLRLIGSPYAVRPGSILTATDAPYKVFTPFLHRWSVHGWLDSVASAQALATTHIALRSSDAWPATPKLATALSPASEAEVLTRFAKFNQKVISSYDTQRNIPALDATSKLSPALRWGLVHLRTLLAALTPSTGSSAFQRQLAWREFYADMLWHCPAGARTDLSATLAHLEYYSGALAAERFAAWCSGITSYPIVDAGMRQLLAEGWLPNRVRMIVASFLVKDLHIYWTQGAYWFMNHLVDGDLASNQLGWQWVAGTGVNAAPYFHVFNPVLQGKKFDPEATYVKCWVPELRNTPKEVSHEPWLVDLDKLDAALLWPGFLTYPSRIINHAVERGEALRRYAAARNF